MLQVSPMTAHRVAVNGADVVMSSHHRARQTLQDNAESARCDVEAAGLETDTIRVRNPESVVNFVRIKSDDDDSVNQYDWGRHIAQPLEIVDSRRVAGNVLLLKRDALLRKILFRFIAEQSTLLRVHNHGFHGHCFMS